MTGATACGRRALLAAPTRAHEAIHSRPPLPASSRSSAVRAHASSASALRPTFRANRFPKVTGPICRLPLHYFTLSIRGCTPWKPDAVMSTTKCKNQSFPPSFKDRSQRTGRSPDGPTLYQPFSPISSQSDSRAVYRKCDVRLLKRKDNSSQGCDR